ncbi:hypothetical protein RHMOL_Rhmol06G0140400 [Rhododendron molle]|uniref:Uncharacterized protein n=1 Tax=Rhododendron molle TaxID=49168 RepID=A0ACC0NC12_RHOML|nr:hypothetical protein RHMOL_Rhmol06G0140400 [Rhododendron molle]
MNKITFLFFLSLTFQSLLSFFTLSLSTFYLSSQSLLSFFSLPLLKNTTQNPQPNKAKIDQHFPQLLRIYIPQSQLSTPPTAVTIHTTDPLNHLLARPIPLARVVIAPQNPPQPA